MTAPLPAIGETVSLHGGSITRIDERRFIVLRADGLYDRGCNSARKPEIRYAVAVNILRQHAGLDPLPLPCLNCLEKPRRGTNCFCSGKCESQHYGAPVQPERKMKTTPERTVKGRSTPETPMPPLNVILERLRRLASAREPKAEPIKPEAGNTPELLPSLQAARLKADALIARREAAGECLTRRAS